MTSHLSHFWRCISIFSFGLHTAILSESFVLTMSKLTVVDSPRFPLKKKHTSVVRDYPKVIWGLSTGIAIIDACVKSIIQLNQPTTDRISLHYLHTDMYLSILCSLSQ